MPSLEAAAPPPTVWEEAYQAFETPEEEIRKFVRRLERMGAGQWPRDAEIAELFCGRGNGLQALRQLGFSQIEGIDLSPALASRYSGPGRVLVGDCRALPFPDASKDIVIVQGGLHHLLDLPHDLERTLAEARRVLRDHGRFFAVEPWLTPFLRVIHRLCRSGSVRRFSRKFDALATMIEHERETYEQWLNAPQPVLAALRKSFREERLAFRLGKIYFLGRKE